MHRIEGRHQVIKVELKKRENIYESCLLETQNSGLIQIICKDKNQKDDLISLIGGNQVDRGTCLLEDVDTKENINQYKKIVDIIDLERVDSILTVKNYLVFYAMVIGGYNDKTINKLHDLLVEIGLESVEDKRLNDLNSMEKIMVRCLASYLKEIKCLIGKNLLEDLGQLQRNRFFGFLKKYFIKNHCLCLLFENSQLEDNEMIDETIII